MEKLEVCRRCGGIFRSERCLQCGWAGEQVTDRNVVLPPERDKVFNIDYLVGLKRRLCVDAARAGLEDYTILWEELKWGDWSPLEAWLGSDLVHEAVVHALRAAGSERVKPSGFVGFIRSRAHRRLRELLEIELDAERGSQ